MGGMDAGKMEIAEHPVELWQKTTNAMRQVLGDERRRLIRADELRRAIEDLPQDQYEALPYFDKWIRAVRAILVEKGVLTHEEIDARIEELRAQRAEA